MHYVKLWLCSIVATLFFGAGVVNADTCYLDCDYTIPNGHTVTFAPTWCCANGPQQFPWPCPPGVTGAQCESKIIIYNEPAEADCTNQSDVAIEKCIDSFANVTEHTFDFCTQVAGCKYRTRNTIAFHKMCTACDPD